MTTITCDWHNHSRHSCECHEIGNTLDAFWAEAGGCGIADLGLSDHLHSRYNLPDIAASRAEFLARPRSPRFHFGVEVTCLRRWELDEIDAGRYSEPPIYGLGQHGPASTPAIALDEEIVAAHGIEFVIGGVHWARGIEPEPDAVIDCFHRQHMFLACSPLVDVVAHPWWWHNHFTRPDGSFVQAPWTADFDAIPRSLHDEFASAMLQHGTALEVNHQWLSGRPYGPKHFEQYLDYLAYLKGRGVKFSVGSDTHGRPYKPDFEAAAALLDRLGIADADLWRLPPRKE